MSPCSRLKAEIGGPAEEPIQSAVTRNSISIERGGGTIEMRFSSLLQCEVELCLSEADAKDFIQQLSCFTQTH